MVSSDYEKAALSLGWSWSSAHDGYINSNHKHRQTNSWSDYKVAADAEEACFWDGIESDEQARALVAKSSA